MPITMNMLADRLSSLGLETERKGDWSIGTDVRGTRLLVADGDIRQDDLVISHLYEYDSLPWDQRPSLALCLSREGEFATEPDVGHVLLVVRGEASIAELSNLVSGYIADVRQWILDRQHDIIAGSNLPRMLEGIGVITENHIAVCDSFLQLICSTKGNVPEDDSVTTQLVANGYHTKENRSAFRKAMRFDAWRRNTGSVFVNSSHEISPYDVVGRIFKFNSKSFMYVIMTCNKEPVTQGLLDRFDILNEVFELEATRKWEEESRNMSSHDALIDAILAGKLTGEADIAERASSLGLEPRASWVLVSIGNIRSEQFSIPRYVSELERASEGAIVSRRKDEILVLKWTLGDAAAMMAELREAFLPLLESYETPAYMSSVFPGLHELGVAYRQTRMLAEMNGAAHADNGTAAPRPWLLAFDDEFLSCSMNESLAHADAYLATSLGRRVSALAERKRKNGTDNVKLLFTYIESKCNAAETSKRMFMHRNNVLYHMDRIEEAAGLDLDDPRERTRCLFLCALLLAQRERPQQAEHHVAPSGKLP